jgi:Rrf2 family protein
LISLASEYSLRAIMCLATRRNEPTAAGAALTTQQIAERARIPAGYLAKVLQVLGRAGLVTSQRGLNGGFVLKGDPATISLLSIVAAVEPSRRISGCPLGLAEHRDRLCPLHRRLDDAAAGVEEILRTTTVAQLLAESASEADGPTSPVETLCRGPNGLPSSGPSPCAASLFRADGDGDGCCD